jgi:hypothetical protein
MLDSEYFLLVPIIFNTGTSSEEVKRELLGGAFMLKSDGREAVICSSLNRFFV